MENTKLRLILASASPRRRELLGHLQLPFEIITSDIKEESACSAPEEFCQDIARQKGEAVFAALTDPFLKNSCLVVSADTIVCLENRIFGKPRNRDEAREFLLELSGKTHSVFTAVALKLACDGQIFRHAFVEESRVTFNKLSPFLMEKYLDTGDSLDKAGAYGIQGPSLTFISRVEGCYSNVVGFPLSKFVLEVERFLQNNISPEVSWPDLF